MNNKVNQLGQILPPSALYGALLERQMTLSDASVVYLWFLADGHAQLHAVSGENYERMFTTCYQEASALAEIIVQDNAVKDEFFSDGSHFLGVPLCQNGKAFACTLLCLRTNDPLDSEKKELTIFAAEIFAEMLSAYPLENLGSLLAPPFITLTNVTKEYGTGEGKSKALDNVNLHIRRGELVAVLGESGCGKSTLLNIIGGMAHPTSGKLTVDGKDYTNATDKELTDYRRDTVSFIFQFYNLLPDLTAKENVSLSVALSSNPLSAENALDYVGLLAKKDKFPSQLSGGEQQRVAIARALAKQTDLLLCDEPTGALDIETGKKVLSVIRRQVTDHGKTAVIVTHNAGVATIADRIIRFRDGKPVEELLNPHISDIENIVW